MKTKSPISARRQARSIRTDVDGMSTQSALARKTTASNRVPQIKVDRPGPKQEKPSRVTRPKKRDPEALLGRLDKKRAGVANDNRGRERRRKESPKGAARPFGQKVVLYLLGFTFVLIATFSITTLMVGSQVSLLANIGFAIGLACIVSCIPVVDSVAKVVATFLSIALIGLYSLFMTSP